MFAILRNRTFAALFAAQIVALLGTGLMSVALGLLAFGLAGDAAGAVLGTALAIKMLAYVVLSPVMAVLTAALPRKTVMIVADLVRAAVALSLPFISEIWQIYLLILLLQAASATFTPVFQAAIPDILTDEKDYTNALSLSRLAYDLENLLSPALAAVMLSIMSFHYLFAGTTFGFLASAALVLASRVPLQASFGQASIGQASIGQASIGQASSRRVQPFRTRLLRGGRIYLATPRLRGLLALNLTAASIGAFVLVNSVVMVKVGYGLDDWALAKALAAFGAGSMLAALALPPVLGRLRERSIMMPAAALLVALALGFSGWLALVGLPAWPMFLTLWAALGLCYTAILTPAGRLLRISANRADRPAIFTAQFALSHACWLLTYPVAGWVGQGAGMAAAMAALAAVGLVGLLAAYLLWPAHAERILLHSHPELAPNHPHLHHHESQDHSQAQSHAHAFVIDDDHRVWPTNG